MAKISYISALFAGLLTFLSPCILPLIPGYLSFITGLSLEQLKQKNFQVFLNSLLFCLGFSVIFVALGASATWLGHFFLRNLKTFSKIGAVLIIVFGLQLSGFLNIKFLNREKRIQLKNRSSSAGLAFVLGIIFAFGWTPCIGPILASLLVIASNQKTIVQGILLLTFYAVGLSLPFILTALAIKQFLAFLNIAKKYFPIIKLAAGLLLILMGILLLKGGLAP